MKSIKLPVAVSIKDRADIKKAFMGLVDDIDGSKVNYIRANLAAVIERLFHYDEPYLTHLAQVAVSLSRKLRYNDFSKDKKRRIYAALYYLVDPLDVIPDHITGFGYVDDAVAANLCINYLKKEGSEIGLLTKDQCMTILENSRVNQEEDI